MIQSTNKKAYFSLIGALVLTGSIRVHAQQGDYEIYREIRDARTLGKHYFTPIHTVKSPFILTNVRTSLGIGEISNISVPLLEVADQQYFFMQGNIFTALLSFEYQHAVKNWLAVYLEFGLVGRLGSDFATLMTEGVNYASTFNIGWLIKVWRYEKFALSASFGVTNGDYSFISIDNFVDEIIAGNQAPSPVKSKNSLYGTVGIKAAYGVSELLGFNVSSDLGYGETIQRELKNTVFTITGINIDLNFSSAIKTPVSLSLGYLYSNYPKSSGDKIFDNNVLLMQLNYIGRTNFIMSLEFTFSREFLRRESETYWLNSLMFNTRYLL